MKRCRWVDEKSEIYVKYHDEEWGVPKYDDRELFELLILESFQAGLSWITILKRREGFRQAFDNFDVAYAVMLCLNSRRVCDYLKSHTFEDAKRPYTKKLLMQLSLKKMVQSLSLDELRASEVRLKLEKRINDSMLGNLLSFMQQRGRQEEPVP